MCVCPVASNPREASRVLGPEHRSLLWQWAGTQEVLHGSWLKSRPPVAYVSYR